MNENWRSVRATVAIAVLAGSIVIVGSAASAQDAEQTCITIDNDNTRLLATAAGVAYTKIQPVELPAGVIEIPSARAWDAYPTRASTKPQTSERYEIEFLDASGAVIATSQPTEDVPDGVMEGEWIGSLGSVTLPVPAAGVRAHHRNDLPFDGSPDSVNAGEFTLCFSPMQVTTTTTPVTTIPGETTTTAPGETTTTEPVTTVPGETTTTEPVTTVPGETTTTTPAETTSTTGVDTTPLGPTTSQATTSTTAATTSTTAKVTTSTTTKPLSSGLPVTGSNTGWLLGGAAVLVAAGTVLLSLSQRSGNRSS